MRKLFFSCSLIVLFTVHGWTQEDFYQDYLFTKADTLRGALRPERTCYDVHFYELNLKVDIAQQHISGYVDMAYEVMEDFRCLQVDLYDNMQLHQITHQGKQLPFKRLHNAVFIDFSQEQLKGTNTTLRLHYSGKPTVAERAPWDGGFVWSEDENGKPWVGVACEGDGASLWWPNKDHLSDEPDSVAIKIAVPDSLVCASNGNLRKVVPLEAGYTRYDWFVSYPINNYNISITVGDFTHFSDTYTAADGDTLALDYYVLSYNLEKAQQQFAQVPEMLACYERYFDKYPFWNDGFAMIETPYLGMEHQSGIAYGNQYMRGYLGGMIPEEMDWDFIIIHETGHEYFGNSISCNDHAEMWIHESFTTYMEALYVECKYSYADALGYLHGQRRYIQNRQPIIGPGNVNWKNWVSSDHYYKGAWVLHTLRHAIGDDAVWWGLLKSFYQKNAISMLKSEDFFKYVKMYTGRDFKAFFQQYLYYPDLPTLEYELKVGKRGKLHLRYRWKADVPDFDMSVLVGNRTNYQRIFPTTTTWKKTVLKHINTEQFRVATELFYVNVKQHTID
ncbi:MAG: M1 family metallopeptidase [Bacteroidota bacterium]